MKAIINWLFMHVNILVEYGVESGRIQKREGQQWNVEYALVPCTTSDRLSLHSWSTYIDQHKPDDR